MRCSRAHAATGADEVAEAIRILPAQGAIQPLHQHWHIPFVILPLAGTNPALSCDTKRNAHVGTRRQIVAHDLLRFNRTVEKNWQTCCKAGTQSLRSEA
jgi:hypothetical protein